MFQLHDDGEEKAYICSISLLRLLFAILLSAPGYACACSSLFVRRPTGIPDNGKLPLHQQQSASHGTIAPGSLRLRLFCLSIAIFLIDQLSKLWIVGRLGFFEEIVVIPNFFHLIHVRNTGAAFGMLAEAPDWLRVTILIGFSSTAVVALVYFLWQASASRRYGGWCLRYGLALILGGALGNIFDRAYHGNVVDFLDFFIGSWHWYTFNIADSAICVGTGLMLIDLWRANPENQAHAS